MGLGGAVRAGPTTRKIGPAHSLCLASCCPPPCSDDAGRNPSPPDRCSALCSRLQISESRSPPLLLSEPVRGVQSQIRSAKRSDTRGMGHPAKVAAEQKGNPTHKPRSQGLQV